MEVKISVRNLVEFLLRSGDIDNRNRSVMADNAMQEGSRIHRLLQRKMGADYQAEVPLSYTYETEGYQIIVEGRADGIYDDGNKVCIDEIKGTYRDVMKLKEANPVHLAQAKCYAFIYVTENSLLDIKVRMTYCNIDTEEVKYFYEEFTSMELRLWFLDIMEEYQKWAAFEVSWKEIRQNSIHQLIFPFPYREGQKELAEDVYRTIYHKKKLFIEAPTGVGKTISTVFPAVKAVGEEKADKIFYLTAKTITRTVAADTFSLMKKNGLMYKTIVLTAKEKTCTLDEVNCNPVACERACGHYDRINDAMYDLLCNEDTFTREIIEQYAKKHCVCPFEMSLDISLFADAVICDYNYLFDPHVYLKRFFAEGKRGNYVFLIDEAHNLVDRGREMYSANLKKEAFLEVKSELKHAYDVKLDVSKVGHVVKQLMKALDACNQHLLGQKRLCMGDYRLIECPEELEPFAQLLRRLGSKIEEYLEEEDNSLVPDTVLDFYFELSHYLLIWEEISKEYEIYTCFDEGRNFGVRLFCVNPALNLKKCMNRGISSILFSATLLPIQYYKRLLGGEKTDYEVYAKSVFTEDQMGLFITPDVTTRYVNRTEEMYGRIAMQLKNVVSGRQGNYMVFFPSHSFAQKVYNEFSQIKGEDVNTILQAPFMGEESREEFLNNFYENSEFDFSSRLGMEVQVEEEQSLVAFSVMGGIFSEGIDLKGKALIGAIIVGNGFPQLCRERVILKEYFDRTGENGFDYAYRYPGMNKVLQSAGRVIRTAEDRGIVVLMEERFLEPVNQRMFPREWSHYQVVRGDELGDAVKQFWNNIDQIEQ